MKMVDHIWFLVAIMSLQWYNDTGIKAKYILLVNDFMSNEKNLCEFDGKQ